MLTAKGGKTSVSERECYNLGVLQSGVGLIIRAHNILGPVCNVHVAMIVVKVVGRGGSGN